MVECSAGQLRDEVFTARARAVVNRHMAAGEIPTVQGVLDQLGVAGHSQQHGRSLIAQVITELATRRVRDWVDRDRDVQKWVKGQPEDRAGALRKAAEAGREQLPGIDFAAVDWQAVVDSLLR